MDISRVRGWAANLLLAVCSFATSALLAEVALQIAVPLFRPRFTCIDPIVGWYHNASVTNPEVFKSTC